MGDLLREGYVLHRRWQVQRKIGSGGYGAVYEAQNRTTGELVAVKVEPIEQRTLHLEAKILKKLQGRCHFCRYICYLKNIRAYFLVMELQGNNLRDLRKAQPGEAFSLNTTLRVGLQILNAIETLHSVNYTHGDIKANNFAVGRLSNRCIYMLDFGLARRFITAAGTVRRPRRNPGFRGTHKYASINAHDGKELGRRDDLWSFFYMLVECITGTLPWQHLRTENQIGLFKKQYNHHLLQRSLPQEFEGFLSYIESLQYEDAPNYQLLKSMFENCITRNGINDLDPFDWE